MTQRNLIDEQEIGAKALISQATDTYINSVLVLPVPLEQRLRLCPKCHLLSRW